jgi:hypothetical protein
MIALRIIAPLSGKAIVHINMYWNGKEDQNF